MRFQPKTEKEVQANRLLKEGECDFVVKQALDAQSNNGNDMIKLVLQVWDAEGEQATVFDYLLESMPHKLRHFAYNVGLNVQYENGSLEANDCEGREGKCIIRTEKDKTGKYPDKNAVADYVVSDETKQTAAYQQAKVSHKNAASPSPKVTAWKDFCTATATLDEPSRTNEWRFAIKNMFGDTVTAQQLNDSDWEKFICGLPSYKIGVGFPRQLCKAMVANPIGEGTEIDPDDIPF